VEHVTAQASHSLATTDTREPPLPGGTRQIKITCGRVFD
jgi:hypothetical protein